MPDRTPALPAAAALAALAVLCAGAPPALGQSLCGRVPDPSEVAGIYGLAASKTLLSIQGMRHLDASSVGTANVHIRQAPADSEADVILTGIAEIGTVPLRLSDAGQAPCGRQDDDAFRNLAEGTIPASNGIEACGPSELPRAHGAFPWQSVDGMPLTADICLLIRNLDMLNGSFAFATADGGTTGIVAWSLRRAD